MKIKTETKVGQPCEIKLYLCCAHCASEKPENISFNDYQSVVVGIMGAGPGSPIQIWCKRHKMSVAVIEENVTEELEGLRENVEIISRGYAQVAHQAGFVGVPPPDDLSRAVLREQNVATALRMFILQLQSVEESLPPTVVDSLHEIHSRVAAIDSETMRVLGLETETDDGKETIH